jgi:hypothetical protein
VSQACGDDDPQTAMMLTQQEWGDIAAMLKQYRQATNWFEWQPHQAGDPEQMARRRLLAQRIIDAA